LTLFIFTCKILCLVNQFYTRYSGALTIIRLNGSKEIDQTNNIKAKELPKWERRLNKRINNIRRDLGRITQYLKGINSNHLNNIIIINNSIDFK
jgi:hypothetical protein